MPIDVELVRALLLLSAVLGLGGMAFAVLYGTVAIRMRSLTRRVKAARALLAEHERVILGLKTDLLAGAARIRELEGIASQMEKEVKRVDKIRARAEEGCAAKHDELELARRHLELFVEHVDV